MKLAIAGLGHFHIHMFLEEALALPETEIVGLYDSDAKVLQDSVKRYGAKGYDTLQTMLDQAGAQVVVTASVNKEKADIIQTSLEAGYPVIADKPLVTTVEDFYRVKHTFMRQKNAKLYMMLTERFNPVMVAAKKLIDDGKIGKPVNIISIRPHKLNIETRPSWFFKRDLYGGLMNDLGVHDMDVFRWFTDSEIERIHSCFEGNLGYPELTEFKDHSEAAVLMECGATAYVRLDWLTPKAYPTHGDCRFIIIGTTGQIEVFTYDNRLTFFNNDTEPCEIEPLSRDFTLTQDIYEHIKDPSRKTIISTDDIWKSTWASLKAQEYADANLGGLKI